MTKIVGISLVICLLTLTGCGDSRLSQFKDGVISSCVAGGTPEDICSCSYDAMEDHYSEKELLSFAEGNIPVDFLEFAQKATLQCVKDNS